MNRAGMQNGEMLGNLTEQSPERKPATETKGETEPQRETAPQGADVRDAVPLPSAPPSMIGSAVEKPVQTVVEKDAYRMRVERTLEENLWELYFALPKGSRERFREEGEKTAAMMRRMLEDKKIRPNEVHRRVDLWLKTIPKVNPWFLLQEGKIKTDNIMALVKEKRAENGLE